MTIKQQGGIFGRNPTFNDVDVEGTLTVGGTYTLPTTDGTIGQVLTTDGSGVVTFADAGGGGGGTYTAGTGLSLTGTVFANTAPDQTVSLTQGGATTISGTYPNFTISSTDTNTTYTAGTGLALTGTVFSNTITNNNQLTNGAAYVDNAGVDTHLNTGTATTGEVLSWTGTDYDWITAGGGTALELYTENPVTPTAPSATGTNAVAIGSGAIASGTSSIALATLSETTGDYAVSIGAGADALGTNAVGIKGEARYDQTTAIGTNSGTGRSIAGIAGNSSSNAAMALGGSYASGADSFAAAITNNTSSYGATGANSIAMGYQARATQADGIAIGDRVVATGNPSIAVGRQITASGAGSAGFGNNYYGTNTVSGAGAVVVTGGGVTASGTKSAVFGSYSKATAERSFAFGINATALTYGKFAFSAKGFNQDFYVDGSAQAGLSILSRITTDGTSAYLTGSTSSASADQIILPNNSAYSFSGMIVARQDPAAGTACAAWKVEGIIRREANAASTVLVNYALTVLDNTPAWDITLTADTTVGALKITATGAAATTIRWVATINTAEVNFLN